MNMSRVSRFDQAYRSILLSKFFVKGWGNPEKLQRILEFRKTISNRETCRDLVKPNYPIYIDKKTKEKDHVILHGHFKSPLADLMPGIMPQVTETAKFQMILPHEDKWNYKYPHLKPICLHLAGTGDHGYSRRKMLTGLPLLKNNGIGSILLENPYYGVRRPKEQRLSRLRYVSDLYVMGGALILESLALFHWCERQGYGPLGITGISMGGFMASLAASNWHKPLALIPCLSWSTASTVFCEGVMASSVPWQLLEEQYKSDDVFRDEISKLIISPERNSRYYKARQLGHDFAKNYPQSLADMKEIQGDQLHNPGSIDITQRNQPSSETRQQSTQKTSSAQYHTSSQKLKGTTTPEKSTIKKLTDKIMFNGKNDSRSSKRRKSGDCVHDCSQETFEFMKGLMDECTHVGNYSVPVDPSLIITVSAKADAYVLKERVTGLEELWPGSEVRHIDAGHVNAFLRHQEHFRKAISDAFDRQAEKHYKDGYPGKYV